MACTNPADIYILWWIVKNKRNSSEPVDGAARMPEVLYLPWCRATYPPLHRSRSGILLTLRVILSVPPPRPGAGPLNLLLAFYFGGFLTSAGTADTLHISKHRPACWKRPPSIYLCIFNIFIYLFFSHGHGRQIWKSGEKSHWQNVVQWMFAHTASCKSFHIPCALLSLSRDSHVL